MKMQSHSIAGVPVPMLIVVAALVVLPPILMSLGLTMTSASEVVIFAIACMALNILVGQTGLVSFGHGAWFSMAAYVAAIVQRDLRPGSFFGPLMAALAAVAIASGLVGALITDCP